MSVAANASGCDVPALTTLHLFSAPLSLFSAKVEIALHEKRLAFSREFVPFALGTGYQPKNLVVARHNPKGQVPLLLDGELPIYDSTQIFEYLEDAYPETRLWPRDVACRAIARQWELWSDEILFAPVRELMARGMAASDREVATANYRKHLAELNLALAERDYVAGEFSFADIALFMTELFSVLVGVRRQTPASVARWRARVYARDSVRQVVDPMADYAEAAGILRAAILIGRDEVEGSNGRSGKESPARAEGGRT